MTALGIELDRRIHDLLREDGDHCHGCRRPYQVGDLVLIGAAGGRVLLVGKCCSDLLGVDLGSAIWLAPGDTRSPYDGGAL
jgi:hypothetical protein